MCHGSYMVNAVQLLARSFTAIIPVNFFKELRDLSRVVYSYVGKPCRCMYTLRNKLLVSYTAD